MAPGEQEGQMKDLRKSEKFHLGILPFDPLFVWIGLIYGITRLKQVFFKIK